MNEANPGADFAPLVRAATTAQSLNVRSIMDAMNQGEYTVPEYQRDSSQWSLAKKSLFIESLINHMTVPPLIVYPRDDPETRTEVRDVVDGQQRLTTTREFIQGNFHLADESEVDYADNVGPLIQRKSFRQLSEKIQRSIEKPRVSRTNCRGSIEKDLLVCMLSK